MDIKKTVCVVGSNGFIGRHLTKYLSARRISYVCFRGNLLREEDIKLFLNKNSLSEAIFLAGTFDPPFENLININVITLNKFLSIGIKYSLKKIIFISTGAVYGEPIRVKSKETDPLKPNTLYGLSKLIAEKCIEFYQNYYGLKFIILRCPNIYGEGNRKGVIYKFLSDIKKYKKIIIEGDGDQKRDFLYIDDACLAIEKALTYENSDIFNISNIKCLSINDVVSQLRTKYDFTTEFTAAANNLNILSLDISKAKKMLGYFPKTVNLKI